MSVFVLLCLTVPAFTVVMGFLLALYDTGTAFALFAVLLVASLVLGLIALVVYPSRSVGRTTCRNWSQQTGYPAKFRVLNWADTGTCLARTPDGHWTKNTHIIVNVPARR